MKTVRNTKGFSLIELMIVVAIIGILATIAVPNFTKFQNRAKQAEARANLSAIYSAHKAFFAEWNQYHGVMADIGYVPEGKINYYLVTGASNPPAAATGFVTAPNTAPGGGCLNTASCASLSATVTPLAPHTAGAATGTSTATGFTAQANANLRNSTNNGDHDRWQINQLKAMSNLSNGI